jgi:hypothetical protein
VTTPDYAVTPSALAETAAGIEAVLGALRSLGPLGPAEEGRGVIGLASMPGDVGHAALNTAFVAFCSRWEWGVRAAVHAGEELADGLRAAGAAYGQADDAGQNLLARVARHVVGDPAADTGNGWADVIAAVQPDPRPPDWARLGRQWADTVQDLLDSSGLGLITAELRGADVWAGQVDDLAPIAE